MTNLSKIDQLFVLGLEAHIETMKATPGEDGVTRQLEAQALLQTFKTLGATLILRVPGSHFLHYRNRALQP